MRSLADAIGRSPSRRWTLANIVLPPPRRAALGATFLTLLACLLFPSEPARTQTTAPGGVTGNLKLWLKADAGVTGTSPVTGWNDQSGNGNHATIQLGTPSQTLNAAGLNFNPVVTLAGTGGLQGTFSVPVTSNNVSAFIVMKPNTIGSGANGRAFVINLNGQTDSNNPQSAILAYRNGANIRAWRNNGALSTVANAFDKVGLFGSHFKAGNQQVMVYGGAPQVPVSQTTTAFNADRYAVGSQPLATAAEFLAANIAEVILYTADQAAAGTETRIASYLGLKYGITLGHNYIASDGTTIFWDQTANAGYTNNIAGIGRDDGSGVVQRQSRSSSSDLVTIGLGTIAASNATHGGSFGVDRQFLTWGDNGASDGFETSITPPGGVVANRRMPRAWRVDETGALGQIKLALPAERATGGTIYVIVSGDETLDAADQWIPLTAFTAGTDQLRRGKRRLHRRPVLHVRDGSAGARWRRRRPQPVAQGERRHARRRCQQLRQWHWVARSVGPRPRRERRHERSAASRYRDQLQSERRVRRQRLHAVRRQPLRDAVHGRRSLLGRQGEQRRRHHQQQPVPISAAGPIRITSGATRTSTTISGRACASPGIP